MAVMVAEPVARYDTFDAFVVATASHLWRQAYLLTQDQYKAEDLVQTALAKAWPHFARVNTAPGAFEAYVRRVLYTTFVAWWRRRWNSELATDLADQPASHSPGREKIMDLRRALAGLSRMQRAVVVLRYYEDLSEAQTAELLGISVGSVKTHASRGLARLRQSPALVDWDQEVSW